MRVGAIVIGLLLGGWLSACRIRAPVSATASVAGSAAIVTPLRQAPTETGPGAIPWSEPAAAAGAAPCLLRCPRAASIAAPEGRPRWAFDADAGLYSSYVWRGILVTDDPVLQGSITASKGGFFFNVWANVDLTDFHGTEYELNEVNLTANYTHRVRSCGVPLDLSVGAIAYLFPATPTTDSLEVYLGLTADVLLQPAITVWHEVIDVDSTYVSVDIGHTFDMGCWDLELDAGVGWGDRAWHRTLNGIETTGMNDITLSASAVIGQGRWRLLPKVGYSSLLDGDVRSAVAKPDLWVAALILSTSF